MSKLFTKANIPGIAKKCFPLCDAKTAVFMLIVRALIESASYLDFVDCCVLESQLREMKNLKKRRGPWGSLFFFPSASDLLLPLG
jgi:hypothetical protein